MNMFLKPMFIVIAASCLSQSILHALTGRIDTAFFLLMPGGLALAALVGIWSNRP